MNIISYFRIKCMLKAIPNVTLKELWSGRKLVMKDFEIFGSFMYLFEIKESTLVKI